MKKLLLLTMICIARCTALPKADITIMLDAALMLKHGAVLTPSALVGLAKRSNDAAKITTQEAFDYLISNDALVVVKFSASWCRPCQNFAPIFHAVAESLKSVAIKDKKVEVLYVDIDIDSNRTITDKYNIYQIPTVLYFNKGKVIDRSSSMTRMVLSNKIKNLAASL